jgi:hypothetical protein
MFEVSKNTLSIEMESIHRTLPVYSAVGKVRFE